MKYVVKRKHFPQPWNRVSVQFSFEDNILNSSTMMFIHNIQVVVYFAINFIRETKPSIMLNDAQYVYVMKVFLFIEYSETMCALDIGDKRYGLQSLLENNLKFCLLIPDRKIQEYNQDFRNATCCCTEPVSQRLMTTFSCTNKQRICRALKPFYLYPSILDFTQEDKCFIVP